MTLARLLSVTLIVACLAGCGSKMAQVHGKVTLPDGKPAAGSQVVFQSGAEKQKFTARGDVGPDGTFRMSTEKPGDGVPPGKYNVIVNPPPMVNAEGPYIVPFNNKFTNFSTSGLEFEVKPGAANDFPIQVTK
ncbi:MAG TPA: carboxypeptidase-like regulatory domain-containing protein [Pirellulaceae bacterium]|jgi:hypothetical protein